MSMAGTATETVTEVPVIVVPDGLSVEEFIIRSTSSIKYYAVRYKNKDGHPDMTEMFSRCAALVPPFLDWLGSEVRMTPALRAHTKIDQVVAVLTRPDFPIPEPIADKARYVLARFEDENWGATPAGDDDDIDPAAEPADGALSNNNNHNTSTNTANNSNNSTATQDTTQDAVLSSVTSMRLPRADHPIWGRRGIMHGVALKPGRRASYVLDPRYLGAKRSAKVFGHNGLEVGAWWPLQIVALFRGAHGAPVRGISGDADRGAWSVVLSGGGAYEDLDCDEGNGVWYSGDGGSRDNADPRRAAPLSRATRSLRTSLSTGSPVRVLRAAKGRPAYAPSVGIRYDGLYRVVRARTKKNAHGGLFEQFRLERLADQRPLEDIVMTVPSRQQELDFGRIQERY